MSHLKGVWEDLTICDFLDIIDSWKLVGWGKMGFKAQTCWTDLLAFLGVWNRSRILNFGPDRLFFRFSRALILAWPHPYLTLTFISQSIRHATLSCQYNHFELWSECLPWSVLDQALKVLCCSGERYTGPSWPSCLWIGRIQDDFWRSSIWSNFRT